MNTHNPIHSTFFAALLATSGIMALPVRAQIAPCPLIQTASDASRCIHTRQYGTPDKLSNDHTYSLTELVDIAERSNPETRISWAHAAQAMEKVGVQRADYLPYLALAAEGADSRIINPFPKPLAPRGYVSVEIPAAVVQLELRYSLLDFGRRPRLDASRALETAATLELQRAEQQVASDTATQFYSVQQAEEELNARQSILKTAQTLLSNAQSQFDNGRATLPDVQNAQAVAAEAQYSLVSADAVVKKSKLILTETIGVEPTAEIRLAYDEQPVTMDSTSVVEELLQTAWKTRPDLLAQMQEYKAAKAEAGAAKSKYLPTVSLQGKGGQTWMWPTADYGQLGYATLPTWSASISLKWDLFDGARRHELKAALDAQKAAQEEQRAAQDAVSRQVWSSYVDYQTALEQERAARTYLQSAQTSYDSSMDAFNYGVRSLVDVVQAERQLAEARIASVRALAHRQQSVVALRYALGNSFNEISTPGATHEVR